VLRLFARDWVDVDESPGGNFRDLQFANAVRVNLELYTWGF
jgi:hypothetical protein